MSKLSDPYLPACETDERLVKPASKQGLINVQLVLTLIVAITMGTAVYVSWSRNASAVALAYTKSMTQAGTFYADNVVERMHQNGLLVGQSFYMVMLAGLADVGSADHAKQALGDRLSARLSYLYPGVIWFAGVYFTASFTAAPYTASYL